MAAPARVRLESQRNVQKWIDYESQARAMAMAAELGWSVQSVIGLSLRLLHIHLADPLKSKALKSLQTPKDDRCVARG
jgi:hypothetical protein